ncbi:Uma2 family endonuclease [Vacuolonema iberomarrocanum]|uniref:Uma2 family endonuclease n=1 Tax=Vacuolonema iberomarrocanum TaxID=3454632 RepID=UPI0019EA0EA4|nr:Uma2 family endonuclease [filamentous cyanobacterium LEGE 07170]
MFSSVNQPLPSSAELPSSDDSPVDNEDQNLLPNLLLLLLTHLWAERMDWYFGVDMAIYHTTGLNPRVPVVPDAFLSLGVERKKGGKSRRSYVTWEEQDTPPIWVLEMVSHQPGDEYTEKLALYARLGVLYYVVYNPEFWQRDRHQPFEVYKLDAGTYRLQIGEPYWMPEIGLGVGRHQAEVGGLPQEILTWYDAQGNRHLSAEEQERQRTEQERQARQRLEAYLRSQGIDPNHLPE